MAPSFEGDVTYLFLYRLKLQWQYVTCARFKILLLYVDLTLKVSKKENPPLHILLPLQIPNTHT